jgi:hypothetical protein
MKEPDSLTLVPCNTMGHNLRLQWERKGGTRDAQFLLGGQKFRFRTTMGGTGKNRGIHRSYAMQHRKPRCTAAAAKATCSSYETCKGLKVAISNLFYRERGARFGIF